MNKATFNDYMGHFLNDIIKTSGEGQKEYTGGEDAFGNFNRIAAELGADRKKVLWVYLTKHKDGIVSYLNGHKSQRESVHGRIKDMVVYLILLAAMIAEEENNATNTIPVYAERRRDYDPNRTKTDIRYPEV